MTRFILKTANGLLNAAIILALALFGVYAGYALWDNSQIYAAAENVQADMLKLKPAEEPGESGPTFEELLKVNDDICAWLTIDNTHIDFPVLQGETNSSYINTDVYGNFALAGSIFLDFRNSREFVDVCNLIHGHHMSGGNMFGDLSLYHEKDFFDKNRTGKLLLPEKVYDLEIFAVMLVSSSEKELFYPKNYTASNISSLFDYTEENAVHLDQSVIDELREAESPQILELATCSTSFTNARTVVLAVMRPKTGESREPR